MIPPNWTFEMQFPIEVFSKIQGRLPRKKKKANKKAQRKLGVTFKTIKFTVPNEIH